MSSVLYAVNIIGGVAVFLYGVQECARIFRYNLGDATRGLMSRFTRKRRQAFAFGFVLSAITQSSTIATSFAVGFADIGMLSFAGSVAVMMGASLGGTFVSFLLSLDIVSYAPLMFAAAFALSRVKRGGINKVGGVLQGVSIIFIGMMIIKLGTSPMLRDEWFRRAVVTYASSPAVMSLTACALAGILQSSSAVVALGISMSAAGVIPSSSMLPIAIGVHIGSSAMVLAAGLCGGGKRSAKQLGWASFIYKLAGGCIFIPLIPYLHGLFRSYHVSAEDELVYGQILAALLNVIFIYPFTSQFSVLVERITGSRRDEDLTRPRYLDEDLLNVPAISILLLSREMIRLADYLEAYLQMLLRPARRGAAKNAKKLYALLPAGITELSEHCREYMYRIRISGESEALIKRFSTLAYTMAIFSDMGKLLTGGLRKCLDGDEIIGEFKERLGEGMWDELSELCLRMLRTSMRAFVIRERGIIDEAARCEREIAQMSLSARRILVERSLYGRETSQVIHMISLLQGLAGMSGGVAQGEEFSR